MTTGAPDAVDARLAETLTSALQDSDVAAIAGVGRESVHAEALTLCTALARDLAGSGSTSALRRWLAWWIPEVLARGASLHDLRKYARLVRHTLLAYQREGAADQPAGLDDWLFEFGFGVARAVVAQRNQQLRQQEAAMELQRAELDITNRERARLDDLVQDIWIPIAPIFQGVLTVPLVGELDLQRADDLTARLLYEIDRTSASHVLVDLSGVDSIAPATARHLAQMAATVVLLGAKLALVGIKPAIARIIVQERLAVQSLTTHRHLRDGLVWALEQLGLRIAPLAERTPS